MMTYKPIKALLTQKRPQQQQGKKKKKKGRCPPSHRLQQPHQKISSAELETSRNQWLGDRGFAVHLLLRRFGDGTESNLQLLHHSRGTITYCSPMLENTIHRSSAAQWAESEGCLGTHRRLCLLRPQHWCVCVKPFIQFCQWHCDAILLRALWWNLAVKTAKLTWKTGFCVTATQKHESSK